MVKLLSVILAKTFKKSRFLEFLATRMKSAQKLGLFTLHIRVYCSPAGNKCPDCAISNNSSENFIITPLSYATCPDTPDRLLQHCLTWLGDVEQRWQDMSVKLA